MVIGLFESCVEADTQLIHVSKTILNKMSRDRTHNIRHQEQVLHLNENTTCYIRNQCLQKTKIKDLRIILHLYLDKFKICSQRLSALNMKDVP